MEVQAEIAVVVSVTLDEPVNIKYRNVNNADDSDNC